MAPPHVFILAIVLVLTATLPVPAMARAESRRTKLDEDSDILDMVGLTDKCSPLKTRQDLLDKRMNARDAQLTERDADLNGRLNGLNTHVNSRLNGIDARLNRLDSRFDELSTEILGMKEYLQQRITAIDAKADLAVACSNCKNGDNHPTPTTQIPKDCQEALAMGHNSSGVYRISPEPSTQINVYCEQELDQGGWVVFQLRKDGTTDFYRDWTTYKNGFGELTGEFWLGNTNIHLLTKHHDQRLKIELTAPDGEVKYAEYGQFWIEDQFQKYKLHVTGFSGGSPPGDSMEYHDGSEFSTRDADNDQSSSSCARNRKGAWWYKDCNNANLNGLYGGTDNGNGVTWGTWKAYKISLKGSRMMMKKRD